MKEFAGNRKIAATARHPYFVSGRPSITSINCASLNYTRKAGLLAAVDQQFNNTTEAKREIEWILTVVRPRNAQAIQKGSPQQSTIISSVLRWIPCCNMRITKLTCNSHKKSPEIPRHLTSAERTIALEGASLMLRLFQICSWLFYHF